MVYLGKKKMVPKLTGQSERRWNRETGKIMKGYKHGTAKQRRKIATDNNYALLRPRSRHS